MLYVDSAYVAKCYLNDPDSERVRDLVRVPVPLYSSALCVAEVSSAIYRRCHQQLLSRRQARDLGARFRSHVEAGTWTLVPLSEGLLWEVHEALEKLAATVFLHSGDAIHLVSARRAGFSEIWSK